MTCQEADPLLNARLDNELDAAESVAIDQHMAECRACTAQYAALENLHRRIVDADLGYTPTAAFRQKVMVSRPRASGFWNAVWGNAPAIAVAAAVVVVALLFFLVRAPRETSVEVALLDSHLRALQSTQLVDVPSSDKHTVKPWFQGKTSFSPPVPDLHAEGFELVGGRLEVIEQRQAAAIVYRRRQHVISLYVGLANGRDAAPESRDMSGYHLVGWAQNGMRYLAVSDLDPVELRKFADLVRGR